MQEDPQKASPLLKQMNPLPQDFQTASLAPGQQGGQGVPTWVTLSVGARAPAEGECLHFAALAAYCAGFLFLTLGVLLWLWLSGRRVDGTAKLLLGVSLLKCALLWLFGRLMYWTCEASLR